MNIEHHQLGSRIDDTNLTNGKTFTIQMQNRVIRTLRKFRIMFRSTHSQLSEHRQEVVVLTEPKQLETQTTARTLKCSPNTKNIGHLNMTNFYHHSRILPCRTHGKLERAL